MVPLRLQLRNFLSYGDAAPELDFEAFHIACLSGGNGQGKSALLDAITWAIWGEARKSSDARKPDEELLRIGSREMSVDLQFRLDGETYRVVRSFSQSASGKTSKPGLEFQIQEGDADWRALTAESLRATQAVIDERLGIDYETFINSTFLLQGRSDEFTKKKPGERKEILGKILGLGRYDRLAAAAGRRWSAVRETASRLEADAERLSEALGPVDTWIAEREAAQAEVDRLASEVETASQEAARLGEQAAAFDALAREADGHREALESLAARRQRAEAESAKLAARISEADALIARADTIEADHARYEALHAERAAWDEKATLARGVDNQLHSLRLDLQKQTADLETRVARQESDLRGVEERLREDARRLDEQAGAEAKLSAAKAAAEELQALAAVRARRDAAREQIEAIDKRLAASKASLETTLKGLREQIEAAKATAASATADDATVLEATIAKGREATQAQERIQKEGADAAARAAALEDTLARLDGERAAIRERIARIRRASEETCPTCGTPLTDAHREQVEASYQADLSSLDTQHAAAQMQLSEATTRRDALRADYKALRPHLDAARQAEADLAALRERTAQADAARERLSALTEEVTRTQHLLQTDTYEPELRARRTEQDEILETNPLDEARYETVRDTAALVDHWTEQVRTAQMLAERVDMARGDIQRRSRELAEARDQLAQGAFAQPLRQRIGALESQLAAVGYDPAAHETVTTALAGLAEAPRQLSRLLEARRNRGEWDERRTALAAETAEIEAQRATRQQALDDLGERLTDRAALLERREAATVRRDGLRRQLGEAQARRGALDERLARAEQDRKALKHVRADLKEAKKERALYNHLKRAFGKNGIPSLIVEETLPEVEERANALLDKLSGGRTRVVLETLKDKKTGGGTKETLDIRITDAQGVARAYETFSGGEAFRVNFALRIALSQMLAERSGTRIRTLVIDEGFGTQDKEGLQSLIQAIQAIQDDFDKILVITHLDEIKAAFPVRIEVEKRPVDGSTFELIGI